MLQIARDDTLRFSRQRDFEERFICMIGKPRRQWRARYDFAFGSDLIQENLELLFIELKFRPCKNVGILRQDSGVETKRQDS